jgi:hypothetical protein
MYSTDLLPILQKLMGKYNPNIVWNEAHKANMLQRLRETIEEHNASKKDDKMLKKVL